MPLPEGGGDTLGRSGIYEDFQRGKETRIMAFERV